MDKPNILFCPVCEAYGYSGIIRYLASKYCTASKLCVLVDLYVILLFNVKVLTMTNQEIDIWSGTCVTSKQCMA